jgi:hypothetical protein
MSPGLRAYLVNDSPGNNRRLARLLRESGGVLPLAQASMPGPWPSFVAVLERSVHSS